MAKKLVTFGCECTTPLPAMGQKRPRACEHGNPFLTEAQKIASEKPRAPLRPVSEKRRREIDAGECPRTSSTLNPGRGFAVAPAQRKKVKGLVCVGCGREVEPEDPNWTIDPAHLLPRGVGGCDSDLCVIPLCRHLFHPELGYHRAYDAGNLDIHGKLVEHGYFKEMAHAIEAHQLSPLTLAQRLTGDLFVSKRELDVAKARIAELEGKVAA